MVARPVSPRLGVGIGGNDGMGSEVLTGMFTAKELAYFPSQPLGRLATVAADGRSDNAGVGFRVEDDGTILVTGMDLARPEGTQRGRR